jgi:MSHA pilin protein MshA
MNRKQAGFTLIELVVVLVLLGIIGAVATARFQDLGTQAANAVASGIAAEISSGGAINYAASAVGAGTAVTFNTATEDCAAYAAAVLQVGPPAEITVAGAVVDCSAGGSGTCTVDHDDGDTTATAILYCTN